MAIILHVEGEDRSDANSENHSLKHETFEDAPGGIYDELFLKKARACAAEMIKKGYLHVAITQEDTQVKGEVPLRYTAISLR